MLIKERTTQIVEDLPIYGVAKVHQQLLEDNIKVSLNTVATYRKEMKLHAVLAVKQVNTMDSILVMDVLSDTLEHYGTPEIFNIDHKVVIYQ